MSDQIKLDFEGPRRERQSVFKAKLTGIDPGVVGVSAAQWGNVARLLESLFYFAGADRDRYAQPSPEALQKNADLSRSVLSRTRRLALGLGLLKAERPRCRRGEIRSPDQVWLLHDAIDRLVDASRSASGISWDQVGSGGIRWDHIKESPFPPLPPNHLPPSTPARSSGAAPTGYDTPAAVGWGEVLETLEAIGVAVGPRAVAAARSAGASPADVTAVVNVWQAAQQPSPPAWGPGALARRIENWQPGQAANKGFPPVHPDHERAVRSAESETRRRREAELHRDQRREREARAAEVAADRQRLVELEAIARRLPEAEWRRRIEAIANPLIRSVCRASPYGGTALSELAAGLTTAAQPTEV
jgi:hypothetical protein